MTTIYISEYGTGREARRTAVAEAVDISRLHDGGTVSIDGTNAELASVRLVLAGRADSCLVSDGILYEGEDDGEPWAILVCEDA